MMQNETWAEKYKPRLEEDLLISKTCLKDIKAFFDTIYGISCQYIKNIKIPAVLFLFGPSGCGKNSTLDVLFNNYEIEKVVPKDIELNDIDDAEYDDVKELDYTRDLLKCFNYSIFWNKKAIVINDIPDRLDQNAKRKLENLIKIHKGNSRKTIPIIFVLNSYIYKWKPFTDPAIKKAIQKIYRKEYKLSQWDMDTLLRDIQLRSGGDMRSAINNLYLYTLRASQGGSQRYPGLVTLKKTKSTQNTDQFSQLIPFMGSGNSMTNEQDGTEQGSNKDREFNLFHTLGKFLYNKRMDPLNGQHRQMTAEEMERLNPKFYFEPKHMINQLCIDQSLFRLFLQENYVDYYGEIEDVVKMSEVFCESDIMHTNNFKEKVKKMNTFGFWEHEFENYSNEFLNSLIIGNGIMIHNKTGYDRRLAEKEKAYKSALKPRSLYLRRETKAKMEEIKDKYSQYPIPRLELITEYADYIKLFDKIKFEREKGYTRIGGGNSNSNSLQYKLQGNNILNTRLEDEDFLVDKENEDTNQFEQVEYRSVEVSDFKKAEYDAELAKLKRHQYLDDDIENPF